MKSTTVDSLRIARTLIEEATDLCTSADRHLASSGLMILQDALELVFYSSLIELGVDEARNLESKSFDELIGELKKAGVAVPKSGTLKALNKQRVLTKHYAQVAEPRTVQGYFEVAQEAVEAIVMKTIGRSLRDLYLSDFLNNGRAKNHLKTAEVFVEGRQFFKALIEIRKAIFLEFELAYCIHQWKDEDDNESVGGLAMFGRGGWKAAYWKRNRKWIEEHISKPTDYVQIDRDQWRMDALEYGVNTAELGNLQRLTPAVFQERSDAPWSVTYGASFENEAANEANAKYCLDRAIAIILKKQEHTGTRRTAGHYTPLQAPESYLGCPLFKKADSSSEEVHVVIKGYEYIVREIVGGFDGLEKFVLISGSSKSNDEDNKRPQHWISGYLQIESGDQPEGST